MKYSGFSKFYFLVVTYFWGNGTDGEIENILFELINFNFSQDIIYIGHIFFCLRKICHAQSISLFSAYDPHTKDIDTKSCAQEMSYFSRAHNTLSRHTVNFEFTRWVSFIQNLLTKLSNCKICIYNHLVNSNCNPFLDFRKNSNNKK